MSGVSAKTVARLFAAGALVLGGLADCAGADEPVELWPEPDHFRGATKMVDGVSLVPTLVPTLGPFHLHPEEPAADPVDCIVEAVDELLRAEHDRRPIQRLRSMVTHAVNGAERHGVDPALVVAVGYVESRLRPVIGDDGRSCGPWQQQARYHPDVARGGMDEARACSLLMSDHAHAARVAAYQLARVEVCQYNQGRRCLERDLRGDANSYTGRVRAVEEVIRGVCGG